MNKRLTIFAAAAMLTLLPVQAQRVMEKLDRGLVAVKVDGGVYLSWRILGEEYYDVTYNVYRNGTKLNATPLSVSNYTDASGTTSNQYTVKAVVRGVEQTASTAVTPLANNYIELTAPKRYSVSDGTTDITSTFEPNDAIVADVDGDGQMELLVKQWSIPNSSDYAGPDYDRIEVQKLDGTLLWWIDCGPNLWDFQHNETNIASYDWDGDGKAECIMRAADGTTIHAADGKTYVIGDATKSYRSNLGSGGEGEQFVHEGAEYLIYLNGTTGVPYNIGSSDHPTYTDYPLKRLEDGETNLQTAWGDGYGHRSSKHFFGAPYFDGRNPSIFLARGIYTRHKMIAYDVNPTTHQLTTRWTWNCNDSSSPWYGQGYHNYSIADVDWDGRDEIVFGSMVIDDNGKGLSTTGLGHGDAHHVGDLDPFSWGQEVFACNEDKPANNFRDATTSKIYYRATAGNDDGRSIAGNFINEFPGAQMESSRDGNLIGGASHKAVASTSSYHIAQNFRIYWDGDLLEETLNYANGKNTAGTIYKATTGVIATLAGSLTNNDTKGTPCFQGDIFGDWREEVVMRTSDGNIRIYTTTTPTEWRNYTLLADPQYRNAMITQMNGYNQPPHVSYFLGELEGITAAPPAPTMNGKTEVKNGGSIAASLNDQNVVLAETSDATVSVASGAAPYLFTDNAPSWTQGHDDNDNITTTTYTHTLTGSAFTGTMRLVKLGEGTLVLPSVEQTYSGATEVWGGSLNFDNKLTNSRVWLNRFAKLNSNGGTFSKGIEANYGATIRPGGEGTVGTLTTDSLILNYGAIVEFDIDANGNADLFKAATLKLDKKDWTSGPEHLAPVFNIVFSGDVKAGTYKLGEVTAVDGDISNIDITGLTGRKASLELDGTTLNLIIAPLRDATSIVWTASEDNTWQLDDKKNFKKKSDSEAEVFVTGDNVTFNDEATNGSVVLTANVSPVAVTFENSSLAYVLSGNYAIEGTSSLTKSGDATVTINNTNTFTGTVTVNGGKLIVSNLGKADGENNGALGYYTNTIHLNGGTLAPSATITTDHPVTLGANGGTIETKSGANLTLGTSIKGTNNKLTKTGTGTLTLAPTASYGTLEINAGTVQGKESNSVHSYPTNIILNGGTLKDADNINSYSSNVANIEVPKGKSASWYLDSRCDYKGKLTGAGSLKVFAQSIRAYINGNWSQFAGTLTINVNKTGSYTPVFYFNNTNGMPKATVATTKDTEVSNNNKNFALGNVTGYATLSGSGTWTIGALNANTTLNVTISGGKLTKTGTGVMTIKTLQSGVSGTTNVSQGMMYLDDSKYSGNFFGSHEVNVSSNGTLAGRAQVAKISVNNGGVLRPGSYYSNNAACSGALKSSSTIYCYAGSTTRFFLTDNKGNASSRSFLEATGTLSIAGDILVEANSTYTAQEGDAFTLWTCGSLQDKHTNLTLPTLPDGLAWDTSELFTTTGVLKVVKGASGISSLNANEEFTGAVYTISGLKIGDLTTTKARAQHDIKALGVGTGIYVIRTNGESIKVTVK